MASSGYAAWSVIAGEQPTTAKWNILGTNDASFNTGNGFNDGILIARHFANASVAPIAMLNGMIAQRQGGTTGAGSWNTPGTSNTATNQTNVFFQAGSAQLSNTSGVDITITFPTAYNQVPIVLAMIQTANGVNEYTGINSVSATTFKARCETSGGAGETIGWLAIGQ